MGSFHHKPGHQDGQSRSRVICPGPGGNVYRAPCVYADMDPRNRRLATLALVVATMLALVPSAFAARSAPTVDLHPARLPRGVGPDVPFSVGTAIVDGDLRVPVDVAELQLLGASDGDYVAVVYTKRGDYRVERIARDGSRRILVDRERGEMTLSDDGAQLFETRVSDVRPRSVVRVLDPATGDLLQRKVFAGHARVLDADAGQALLGSREPAATTLWSPTDGTVRRVSGQEAYFADLAADRFATYTRAAVDGGCSVLRKPSAPRTVLWRSCDHAVAAVSPDGRRLLARTISLDGPLGTYQVRTGTGRVLTTYQAPTAFGPTAWESRRNVLMLTYTDTRVSLVRCSGSGACERASRLERTPWGSPG